MKIGVISDVHSNYKALETVFQEIEKHNVDRVVFAGDIVGNGPNPSKCVNAIRKNADIAVKGNHDHYVESPRTKNIPIIKYIPHHSQLSLSEDQKTWLKKLPEQDEIDGYLISHSHPKNKNNLDPRLDLEKVAEEIGDQYKGFIFGHYHKQIDRYIGEKHLLNPGAVGMPRPTQLATTGKISLKPQYAILDTDKQKAELKKTNYFKNTIRKLVRR